MFQVFTKFSRGVYASSRQSSNVSAYSKASQTVLHVENMYLVKEVSVTVQASSIILNHKQIDYG